MSKYKFRYQLTIIGILIFITGAASGQNARMGTRYHLIDKDVDGVTTTFEDVEVTTVRVADGELETRLRTNDGRAIGGPLVARPEQVRLIAGNERPLGGPESINVDMQPLDAVNADRYIAWKEGRLATTKLFSRTPDELIDSEGPIEISAVTDAVRSVRTSSGRFEAFSRVGGKGFSQGREIPAFTSVLRKDDEVLITMAWFSEGEALLFQRNSDPFPLYFTAKDLPNGWTFKPNMAWANIQLLSFGKSAESREIRKAGGEISHNSPGCDGLHWLDGTIFRNCCDIHDLCYYKEDPNCTYHSWWFQGSWSCAQCNIEAIFCFSVNYLDCMNPENNYCVLYQWDYNGVWPPNCFIYYGCACPAWCYGCGYVQGQGPCP